MAYKQRSPIAIAEGGTNATTMATADGVAYYDGTRLVTTAAGTATHVLTSNGAGVAPTFQAAAGGGVTTIAGDSGTATGATITFSTTELKNATPQFTASGAHVDFNFGDENDNLIISTTTGSGTITSAGGNAGYGNDCFNALTTGTNNVGLGYGAFLFLNSGSNNCGIGQQPGVFLTTGSHNFIAGAYQPGVSYTSSESSNLIIENDGVVGESNVMRLGTTGSGDHQVNKCFIAAVRGVTTDNADALPVLVDSAGQFGTVSSSARYKDNIAPMADTNVMALTPVNFTYKSDKTNKQQYGLIAEEVAELFPDLAVYNAEGAPESVHYEKLPAILLHELQKQNKRIAALEAQLAAK